MARRFTITTASRFIGALVICFFLYNPVYGEDSKERVLYDKKPLWEVGIGGFAGTLPDYPAADENTFRALAVPIPIYRGKILRVGDEESRSAISGRLINEERFEFDVTLSAAFPVDSGSNDARRDMPDLDYLFGIGPQLIFKIINEPNQRKLNLNLQARAVYSTDFSSLDSRGYVFNPKLTYSQENVSDLNLRISTSVGPVFATEKLMDYFYQVDPEYVTPSRAAYDANAGYLGSNFTFSLAKRFDRRLRLVLGTRLGVHTGATNDDSPLFQQELNVSVFTAFFWSFLQSDKPAH